MEDKNKKIKERPITKFEVQKKVDELKKNSQSYNDESTPSETKQILEKIEKNEVLKLIMKKQILNLK